MNDLINLNEIRAAKSNDNRLWSPADALRACLRDIEECKIAPDKLYIALRNPDKDNPDLMTYESYISNLGRMESMGLLSMHMRQI